MNISPISEILSDIKIGRMVIMLDHIDRENEGDLILAAEFANSQNINFFLQQARGLMYLALTETQAQQLKLPFMKWPDKPLLSQQAQFTFSVDAKVDVTTGVSARERAQTIQVVIHESTSANDLNCPGHVFPIVARAGGVLSRPGHTEAAVDLARLGGLNASAVGCEILDNDGESANTKYLYEFAEKFDIKIGRIEDLINYRKALELL